MADDKAWVDPGADFDRVSVELSSRRTGMSFQRTRMSADRTLMSVIRIALSLISFGFTIFQVFQKLHDMQVVKSSMAARRFGEALVLIGIAMLVSGIIVIRQRVVYETLTNWSAFVASGADGLMTDHPLTVIARCRKLP